MNFTEALRFLDKHINLEARAGYFEDLSLNAMEALMGLSGDPHLAYRTIHVTGTNGKGSTATMIARLLQAKGLKVGRYSSPHLSSITERIEVDGEPISREDFAAQVADLEQLSQITEQPNSYFELLTAVAYRWFAEVAVDVAVVEVGVLGRFDATNVSRSAWQFALEGAGRFRPRCYVRFGALDDLNQATVRRLQDWLHTQGTPIACPLLGACPSSCSR